MIASMSSVMPLGALALFGVFTIAEPSVVQTSQGGFTDADLTEINAYRLSRTTLQNVAAATRVFTATPKTHPEYQALLKVQRTLEDPGGITRTEHGSLSEIEQDVSSVTPMAAALRARGLAPREYVKFLVVLVQGYMVSELQALGGPGFGREMTKGFGETSSANLAFVTANKAAVVSLFKTIAAFTE